MIIKSIKELLNRLDTFVATFIGYVTIFLMKIPGFMKIIIIQFSSWTENSVGVLLIQTICSMLESQKRELLLKINSIMKLRAHFPHNFNIWIPLQLFSPQIKKWLNGSICVLLRILHSSCSCSTLLNGKKNLDFIF